MPEPFKNVFNPPFIESLGRTVQQHYPPFPYARFVDSVLDAQWEQRELKARMHHITVCLGASLPASYPEALAIVRAAAPNIALDGYQLAAMMLPEFVSMFGLEHWEESMEALAQFTKQSTSEFAVRPFIIRDQDRMMAQMLSWAQDDNHHVRRLSTEGCRPRLPWGIALRAFKADPSPILPILETLKHDESDYVRRSVANNLNDISHDNPQVTLAVIERWQHENITYKDEIARRALRTLIKKGDTHALKLLGYHAVQVQLENLRIVPPLIRIGQEIELTFDLHTAADTPQALEIDYAIHFVRTGGRSIPKVFKLTRKTIPANGRLSLRKRHSFRPVTTRRYYAGEHILEVIVNGEVLGQTTFTLVDE